MAILKRKIKCSRCKKQKDLGHFSAAIQKRGCGSCRLCKNEEKKLRYWANPEKARAQSRKDQTTQRIKNPEKSRAKNKRWRDQNPEKVKNNLLIKTYGISFAKFFQLRLGQKNKCALCKIPEEETYKGLFVDHCHKTGKIRGLLCRKCNTGIGLLGDNLLALKRAVKYLEKESKI